MTSCLTTCMTTCMNGSQPSGPASPGLLFPDRNESDSSANTPPSALFSRVMEGASQLCRQSDQETMETMLLDAVGTLMQGCCPGAETALYRIAPDAGPPLPAWEMSDATGLTYRLHDDEFGGPTLCLVIHAVQGVPGYVLSLLRSLLGVYRAHLEVLRRSMTDGLTGLLNRSAFDVLLPRLLARDRRQGVRAPQPVRRRSREEGLDDWVGLLDLDHFKVINDRFGHAEGDAVLRDLADLLRTQFRAQDTLFRVGGEEFVVVLRHTSTVHAGEAFERLRLSLAQRDLGNGCRTTLSLGATRVRAGEDLDELMLRADLALYQAKREGRNRVVLV